MNRLLTLYNNLGKRERLGVLVVLIAIIYTIMDLAFVGPQERRNKVLKADIARVEGELNNVRADMTVVKAHLEKDPFAKEREQLDAFKKVVDEANAFLAKVQSDPKEVTNVLRQVITTTPGITLVSLKAIPAQPLLDAPSTGQAGGKPGASRSVYRRGIEVTVRGNYLALLPYLERLQNLQTRVLWSTAELLVHTHPDATLTITLFTLTSPGSAIG